jgi:prepilin-type N-terminal cleavage/methylation domain-containing protein
MNRIAQIARLSPAAGFRTQRGFSLLEVIFSIAVLLVGLVGVAQLVPASLLLNTSNRTNSSALVVVQHQLDILVNQPLPNLSYADPQTGNFYLLGNPAQSGVVVGSPLVMANNRPLIDFNQNVVPGYNLTYTDTSDPTAATWDLRWAVITNTVNATTVMNKRFVVGARQIAGQGFVLPVTLDTLVSK